MTSSSSSPRPPIIKAHPGVPRTTESWKTGGLRYDISNSAELAAAGDEDATARLRTAQRIAMRQLSRKSHEG